MNRSDNIRNALGAVVLLKEQKGYFVLDYKCPYCNAFGQTDEPIKDESKVDIKIGGVPHRCRSCGKEVYVLID